MRLYFNIKSGKGIQNCTFSVTTYKFQNYFYKNYIYTHTDPNTKHINMAVPGL